MKLKLLFTFLLLNGICYAQSTINNFFSTTATNYAVVTSSTAIDQNTNGESLVWDFNQLTKTENTQDIHSTPTSEDLTTYPGTTLQITTTNSDTTDETKLYIKEANNTVTITALSSSGLTLNYNTNNALLGTYPLNYDDSTTTDEFAGNYIYDADGTVYTGTFSGDIETTVDAYGTLTTNHLGQGVFNGAATRIKSVQNIDLSYSVLGTVGTATITTYSYYNNTNGNLVFRSTRIEVSVTLLSIDQNTITYECRLGNSLGVTKAEFAKNKITISPNPVGDFLNISLVNKSIAKSIVIYDITGKEIIRFSGNEISKPVDQLPKGLYIVTITSESNHFSSTFIKI